MKRIFALFAILMIHFVPTKSEALMFSFTGVDFGGVGAAIMDVQAEYGSTDIKVSIYNTSPISLLNSSGPNTPGIIAFGFNKKYMNDIYWSLYAKDDIGEELFIGADGGADWYNCWTRNIDIGELSSNHGIDSALFNPDSLLAANNLPSGYETIFEPGALNFTEASLRTGFSWDPFGPLFDPSILYDDFNPFIIMENVGLDGQGMLYLSGNVVPTPEPATMLLFCFGLILVATCIYKTDFKKTVDIP